MTRDRYLLLDSRVIESTKNAKLTLGVVRKDKNDPLFIEDRPWEASFNNLYASVIYDRQNKIYKCWYSIFVQCSLGSWITKPREKRAWGRWEVSPDRKAGVLYATSTDGIDWEKPELGIIEFQGSRKNNMVLGPSRGEFHGAGVIKDLHEADPQRRYKAIHPFRWRTHVWFSPDGLHWREETGPGLDHGDTYNCVFWDPGLGRYVLFTRHKVRTGTPRQVRQVSRSESSDFLHWSKAPGKDHARVVFEGLEPHLRMHDMPVFRRAGIYPGLIGLFDTEANRQHVELGWSPDSIEWRRIRPGTPLIPNGRHMNDHEWGCVFASPPIFREHEVRIYYGADKGRFMSMREGSLCLARLRPDGFAGYNQVVGTPGSTASITTRPVVAVAGSLRLSADVAMSGYVKVTLFDGDDRQLAEGELTSRTVTDAEVQWRNGFSPATLEGREIKPSASLPGIGCPCEASVGANGVCEPTGA